MSEKRIKLLFDASIIGNLLVKGGSRTGIFFVAYNTLKEFLNNPEIDLYLYARVKEMGALLYAIEYDKDLKRRCKIAQIYETLDKAIIKLEYLKIKNKFEKGNKILRIFIKLALSAVKLIKKIFGTKVNEKLLADYDALYSPHDFPNDTVLKNADIKKYFVVYDTIPLIFPQYFSRAIIDWFNTTIKNMSSENHYFSISENTQKDYVKYVPTLGLENITTTHLAASENFYPCTDVEKFEKVREKYNIPEGKKYIFSLCSLEPRKNLIMAVKAYLKFIDKHNMQDFVYVLGGSAWGGFIEQCEKEIPDFENSEDKIIRAGYIDDEDLASLYSNSEFFVYTSQYEGFGLPPLEAMQCGKAVLTANNSSLPEVVGNAAVMINFNSIEEHIEAYEKLYFDKDFRKKLEKKSLKRSKEFSWKKCVDTMVNVIKEDLV